MKSIVIHRPNTGGRWRAALLLLLVVLTPLSMSVAVFALVPSGVRTDFGLAGDGQNLDRNWNGHWDGVTARDKRGWYPGMRIPFLGLTNGMVADLTANTDFAQVEAADQQVNPTRFSLFCPEKRQFFLERSDGDRRRA